MVDIAPFRAVHYNPSQVGSIAQVIAPPYDVISPALQDALYAKHANNIVRVDLTKPEPGEGEDGRYGRANRTLLEWFERGVLEQDLTPAFYVLTQTFHGPDGVNRTRTGFFSRARLTPFNEGPILPHERTLKGPKIDRLKLMRATKHNLSPIFGAYSDPKHAVLSVLEAAKAGTPMIEAELDHVENRMWRISDPTAQNRIKDALSGSKLYIADGHHRYETGLAYRDERRQEAAKSGRAPATSGSAGALSGYESILMFASAVEDPGMVIFPTHRLVHSLGSRFDEAALLSALDPFFTRSPAPKTPTEAQDTLRRAGEGKNAFLAATKGQLWLLTAKPNAPWDSVPTLPAHPALRSLDVAVLHGLILEHVLRISPEDQASQKNLRYSKDFAEALSSSAKEEGVEVAFLMNPTKIEEVLRVAEAGEVMPQKSTFFYPKIPSGLVIYPLD